MADAGLVAHELRSDGGTVVFHSRDLATAPRVALVLQGSGPVSVGMWARSVCINRGLRDGSVLADVAALRAAGCAVVVSSPNAPTAGEGHVAALYGELVEGAGAAGRPVLVLAHSAGALDLRRYSRQMPGRGAASRASPSPTA